MVGVFFVVCRHLFIPLLGMAAMLTYENFTYPTTVLKAVLMGPHRLKGVESVSFDVNCRFWKHFVSHCGATLREAGIDPDNIKGPVPDFHVKMHVWACQMLRAARGMADTALSSGDSIEAVNRFLRQSRALVRTMTGNHYRIYVDTLLHEYHLDRRNSIHIHLTRMMARACNILQDSQATKARLVREYFAVTKVSDALHLI